MTPKHYCIWLHGYIQGMDIWLSGDPESTKQEGAFAAAMEQIRAKLLLVDLSDGIVNGEDLAAWKKVAIKEWNNRTKEEGR